MALRFTDSFDHYVTADILTKWTTLTNAPLITAAAGRNGTAAMRISDWNRAFSKTIDAQATWIIGFAFRYVTAPPGDRTIVSFRDGVTVHVDLRLAATGALRLTRAGTSLGLGTAVLSQNTWYYLELKVTISDTVGVAVLRINGVDELNLTAQDTRNAGNATADNIQFYNSGGTGVTGDVDDLYLCDGTGSAPTNDFLGDCRVETILPSGNGNSSQLVGSDANSTDNYLLVDEAAPSTADYVESSTVGEKDTYAFGNVTPAGGTVYAVQVLPYAAKTDAGARSIVSVARLSATEVDSAAKTLSTTPTYLPDIRETKPGGGAWSISDVNSAEFGVKIDA